GGEGGAVGGARSRGRRGAQGQRMTAGAERLEVRSRLSLAEAVRDYGIYLALAVLVAFFSIRVPEFRSADNALLILLQVSVIGIIAIGMTFTILTAGIDLSVGSLLAVAGIMSGLFAQQDATPLNVALAFLLPIAI